MLVIKYTKINLDKLLACVIKCGFSQYISQNEWLCYTLITSTVRTWTCVQQEQEWSRTPTLWEQIRNKSKKKGLSTKSNLSHVAWRQSLAVCGYQESMICKVDACLCHTSNSHLDKIADRALVACSLILSWGWTSSEKRTEWTDDMINSGSAVNVCKTKLKIQKLKKSWAKIALKWLFIQQANLCRHLFIHTMEVGWCSGKCIRLQIQRIAVQGLVSTFMMFP